MKLISLVFFVSAYVLLLPIHDVFRKVHGDAGRIGTRGGLNIKNLIKRIEIKSSFFTKNVSLSRNFRMSPALNMSNAIKDVVQNRPRETISSKVCTFTSDGVA